MLAGRCTRLLRFDRSGCSIRSLFCPSEGTPLFRVFVASCAHLKYRSPQLLEFLESSSKFYQRPSFVIPANIEECKNLTTIRIMVEANYSQLMRAALRMSLPQIAVEIFHEYWKLNVHPLSEKLVSLLFAAHQQIGDIEGVLKDIELVMQFPDAINTTAAIQIIQALSESGDFEKANNLFTWLQTSQGDETLSVLCYNALLSGADKNQSKTTLRNMKEYGVSPNLDTYVKLVNSFGSAENSRELEKILPYMIQHGVIPTPNFLAGFLQTISMIPTYDNKRLGEMIYHLMDQYDIPGNQELFNAFGTYYSMVHSPQKAMEFLEVCEEAGSVDRNTYLCVLQGFFATEDFQGALSALQTLEEKLDLDLLGESYNNLLEISIKQNPLQACDLLLLMDDLYLSPEEDLYDELIYALATDTTVLQFELILEIWRRAVALSVLLTDETMTALVERADQLDARNEINMLLTYMYENNMTITEELMTIFNKPVSSYIDERSFKLPEVADDK